MYVFHVSWKLWEAHFLHVLRALEALGGSFLHVLLVLEVLGGSSVRVLRVREAHSYVVYVSGRLPDT